LKKAWVETGMTGMNFGERIGLLALLLGIAGGCSSMAPEDDTYNTVVLGIEPGAGGGGGGGGTGEEPTGTLPPEWQCLREPLQPVERTPSRVQYRVPIVDFDSQPSNPRAVTGLTVTVCDNAACDPPLPACAAGTMPAPTEQCVSVTNSLPGVPPYVYQLDLPYQFSNGYLKLEAPNYAEMNYILGGPMIGAPEGGSLVIGLAIPVLTLAARANAYRDVGVPDGQDDTGGVLAVRTLDCVRNPGRLSPTIPEGRRAADVSVEAQPEQPPPPAVAWSVSDNNTFSRDDLLTDARGVAGFLNTEIAALVVVARAPVDITYPANAPTYRVRPGVVTLAELRDGLNVWGQ
jgi:hypothetical protein